jgi:hypothetical protein
MPVGTKPVTRKQFKLGDDNVNVVESDKTGDQRPTNCWVPEYHHTVGDKCIQFLSAVGINLDEWQQFCLRESLGLKENGKWSSKEVTLLTPRQNGKTLVTEARELVGLFLLGERLIIHSAQLFPTAHESYLRMCRLIENCPELNKLVHKKRSGNNNVGIELTNGARLLYMARGRDPGRGFSGDLVVLDEAYSLAPEMIGALIPALSARPNPQIWYASSTGHEDSDVLLKARDRGLANEPGIALFEFCASSGCSLDDREEWYRANPALGIRLDEEFIELERRSMSDKEFARERLGLWADTQVHSPVDAETWRALCRCGGGSHPECKQFGAASEIVSRYVAAIDASPDRAWATIALAGFTGDGKKQVEVVQDGPGLSWCVETIEKLYAAVDNPQPLGVCVQSGARAGALIPELEALGVKVINFGTREIMGSTGFFYDSCQDGSLVHLGDMSLAQGLSGARQYMIGGKVGEGEYNGWGWSRVDPTVNITGVCAATYALWGLNMMTSEALQDRKPYEGKPRGGRIW